MEKFVCTSFPSNSEGKAFACNAGDLGLIPGLGKSSRGGNGNPLQHSRMENLMDEGAWRATIHGVAKSQTRLSTWIQLLSSVWHFVTLGTVACQAPLSLGFSRRECWSGLLFPPLEDLPDLRIKLVSLVSPALVGRFFTSEIPGLSQRRIKDSKSRRWILELKF